MAKEITYKILVVGDIGTGKTCIIERYARHQFSQHLKATIGVDFICKTLTWDQNTTIKLLLCDIGGQERFGKMTRVYYQGAVGAFVVFDATRQSTFEATKKWKTDIDSKVTLPNGKPIPVVLLGNKIDLVEGDETWGKTTEEMERFCKTDGYLTWLQTSAKKNIGIDEAGRALIQEIYRLVGDNTEPKSVEGEVRLGMTEENGCCG